MTTYYTRAGIRSNRELAKMTGIPYRTMDRIVKYPPDARGYQIRNISQALGMTDAEVVTVFTGKEEKK